MEIFLQTFGSRLRVRDGIFELTVPDLSGANHHVMESYAPHEIRCIWLQKGTSLSTDAILLALENDVDIIVPRPVNIPRMWRPYFPFLCVARRLKCPALRPPRALMKEKSGSPILDILTGRGTGARPF